MPTYIYQSPFKNGLALVQNAKKKFGFINEQNQEVIPCQYHEATMFSGKLARVAQKGRWGMIDSAGKLVIPLEYDAIAHGLFEHAIVTKQDKTGVFNGVGKAIVPVEFDELMDYATEKIYVAIDYTENKTAVYDFEGKTIIKKNQYESITITGTNQLIASKNGKCGVVDLEGKTIIPFKYEYVQELGNDIFIVYKGENVGAMDKSGNQILPTKYTYITNAEYDYEPSAPYLIVQAKNYKTGLFDYAGKEIFPFKYTQIIVQNPHKILLKTEEKELVVDSTGKRLSPEWAESISFLPDGYYAFKKELYGSSVGILDENFAVICEPSFQDILEQSITEGFLVVMQEKEQVPLYGLFHIPSKKLAYPCEATHISPVVIDEKVYFYFQQNNLWGFLNAKLKFVIPVSYRDLTLYQEDKLIVQNTEGKMGIIDLKSKLIVPFEYDGLAEQEEEGNALVGIKKYFFTKAGKLINEPYLYLNNEISFSEGLGKFEQGFKYGYVNENFEIVIPAQFDEANSFKGEAAVVKYAGKWGAINSEGVWIIPAEYDYLDEKFEKGHISGSRFLEETNSVGYGVLNKKNEAVIPFTCPQTVYLKDDWACYLDTAYNSVLQNLLTDKKIEIENATAYLFKEGAALIQSYDTSVGFYFIDEKGKKLFDTNFPHTTAEAFENGIALFYDYHEADQTNTVYFVNKKGKITCKLKGNSLYHITKDIYQFSATGQDFILLNSQGAQLSEVHFTMAMILTTRKILLSNSSEDAPTYFIFDTQNHTSKPLLYDYAYPYEKEGFILVGKYLKKYQNEMRYGIIDATGKRVLPLEYEYLLVSPARNYAIAQKEGKYGVINLQNEILVPFEYEGCSFYAEDLITLHKEYYPTI